MFSSACWPTAKLLAVSGMCQAASKLRVFATFPKELPGFPSLGLCLNVPLGNRPLYLNGTLAPPDAPAVPILPVSPPFHHLLRRVLGSIFLL